MHNKNHNICTVNIFIVYLHKQKTKIMSRQKYNKLILKELEKEIERHPEQRFWQLLFNLSIVNGYRRTDGSMDILDEYNRESKDTYNRVIETLKERDEQL